MSKAALPLAEPLSARFLSVQTVRPWAKDHFAEGPVAATNRLEKRQKRPLAWDSTRVRSHSLE